MTIKIIDRQIHSSKSLPISKHLSKVETQAFYYVTLNKSKNPPRLTTKVSSSVSFNFLLHNKHFLKYPVS